MGTLLIILCVVFIGIMLYSKYTENNSNATSANAIRITNDMLVVKHPITGVRLQVANQDFSHSMTWPEAKKACNELGSGWRLPTKEELEAMYTQLYEKGLGNFQERGAGYWSSTENGNNYAWYFYFTSGYADDYAKSNTAYVRAVRAL